MKKTIYNALTRLPDDNNEYISMTHAANPYGDGLACKRIADLLICSTKV